MGSYLLSEDGDAVGTTFSRASLGSVVLDGGEVFMSAVMDLKVFAKRRGLSYYIVRTRFYEMLHFATHCRSVHGTPVPYDPCLHWGPDHPKRTWR